MGISPWQLLILLVIVVLLFGTKRLRNLGSDLGNAVKGFKKSMGDEADADSTDKERTDKEADSLHHKEKHNETSDSDKSGKP